MIGVIRAVRYIRGNKIASSPNLYKSIVLSDNQFSSEYDESDDIEYIKLRELEKHKRDYVKSKFG